MSKVEFSTNLRDEQFLYFADNSNLGIILIQHGYLKYFNKRFEEIFGYSQEEISNWKKREFYKIVHSEDLPNLIQQFKIEDIKTVSVRFRGITKQDKIINLENYMCRMTYNNKIAYLSSYVLLDDSIVSNSHTDTKKIKFEIDLSEEDLKFLKIVSLIKNVNVNNLILQLLKDLIEIYKDDLILPF